MKEHIWRYHHPTFFNSFFQPEYTCDSALRLVLLVAVGVKISENPKIALYLLPPRWFLNLASVSKHFMVECRTVKALKGDFSLKTYKQPSSTCNFLPKSCCSNHAWPCSLFTILLHPWSRLDATCKCRLEATSSFSGLFWKSYVLYLKRT